MDKKQKNNYNTPLVKVVSFYVEGGFAATTPTDINVGDVLNRRTAGTETYDSETWTARPFSGPSQTSED